MNEQALQDAYNLFVSNGYQKSIDDFKKLIAANPDALNDSYNLFKSQGYNKSIDDYKNLLGVSATQPNLKKKGDTASSLEVGSSVSPRIEPERPAAESTGVKSIAPIPTVKKEKKDEIGTALNVIGALNKGVYNFFGQGLKAVGTALQGATSKITGGEGRGFISDALINVGDRYLKAIEELNPQDEEFKGSLTDQFSQALGQVGAAVLTGGLSRGAAAASAIQAAPKAVTLGTAAKQLVSGVASPTGAISALGMGQSEFDRAKQAGATDEQAFESFYKNAITGSVLETIPVMQFFKRFNQASAGGVVNYLKTKAIGGITGGIEEMTTEVLQQLYANKTAQDIYNVNQNLFEGVGESGGIGFGVGFLLNAMGAQAKLLRKEGKVEEANVIETQMKEFEAKQEQEDAPAPPPTPVYRMKGVPIVTKEVVEDIIDNAPVPEILNLGIQIDNDQELSNKLQQKIVTNAVREQVKQGNPDLNEPSLNAITELELQLKKLEGNTTQTGKDKAAAIRQQIKNIQENQLQEEAVTETLKTEEDAVQEQATDESVLRTEQPELGLQEVGEGNQGLEVAATGTQEIAPTQPQQQEIDKRQKQLEGVERMNPNAGFPLFNVGQVHNDGNNYIVSNATDNRTNPEAEGVTVISKIIEPAQVDENGKMTKAATVETTIFDSKEDAQKSLQETYNKYKDIAEQNLAKAKQVSSKTQPITQIKTKKQLTPAQEASLTIQEETPVVEPIVQEEQFQPISIKDIKSDAFTKDNAIDYSEDERETDSGRTSTYLSSVTVEARNADGDPIGTITKITDEDKIFYFTAEDIDGNEINLDGFDTLGDAKKAIADSYNKSQKKEFDKAAKKKAKDKAKAEAKKTKKAEKAPVVTPTPQQETPPVEEAEPLAEDLSSIDALLDLDVEDEDNMLKVLNALDKLDKNINKRLFGGANESLLAIPLGTVQLVVKTLKALVKGGMVLRDAIKKVAADNNLSQDIIKDIINISPIQEDFNALMSKVDALIARQKKRGIEDAKIVKNLDTFIRNTEAYKNANDAQKKIMEREGRIKMGVAERRAPSIGRILGVLKDITNVSRQDKLKIISQIRQLSKDAAKDLAKEIRELASTGKITVNQAANVIARFGKVNMLSEISVSSFVDYMTKVFADAEYASKLSAAKNLKSSIASLSKNKEKNADLRELAKQFVEIDPSMVDDIDAYNDMASKIKEAVSGSSIKTQNVNLARTVDIENALEYISKTLDVQDKKMREEKAAEIQQLMGIDVSEFSYDEMVDLLKKDKPISKYNEGIVRSTINKMFNVFSAMITENIKSGEDPITGDKVDYTKEQKRIITEFMDMDLSLLEPKQALEAVDALANFLQNKSTAKMGAMLAEYKGIMGTQTAVKQNLKAKTLKKYGLEWLGKLFAENTTNLNVLFERMFKGFNKGNIIQKLMGIRDVINNKAAAQKESSKKVEDYVQKFYSKLANGEAFNTAYNNVERGISSFMQRTIIGSESQRREFFNTRKKLVKQSIEVLSKGNDKEKEKAKLYQQAYDKLIGQTKGPNENQILENEAGSIEDIRRRTDATNLDAINYWQNSWSEKYDQLYDTALNIYNKVLGRDINYTPDRYSKLSSDTGKVELANDQSAFLNNNDVLYQKESGVLMETTRPDNLPKNRYLDFSFDNNNANSYYEALVDISTAEPIRQVQGFLNSPLYEKVVPNSDDATILKDRIQLFINNFRNKNPYDNDEFSKFVRSLNVLSDIGASMALGGVTQPLKQVVPVAVNTLINAGGLDLSAPFDKAKNDFMSNSGYGIANRGVESQAQVQSMNKLVEEAAKSSPERLLNLIKKGNQLYLKFFLVNADAYIARASWMTYYEKYLNDKGVDTKGIDYNTHKLNKEAADYAQSMVDRQQNVSDADLAGKIFASKAPAVQLLVKTVMPFASFRMNQASRVGSDIAVVTDKTATKEDKTIAIRSLMGYAAETVTFRLISGYIAYQLGTAALKLLDREESEEEKEKRKNNLVKGQVTGTVTDVLSPAPIADKFVQSKVNDLVGAVQTGMNIPLEKQYNIFGESKQDYVQNMGMYGIASERAAQLFEISQLAATGKYTDDFGKEKTISEKDQETLKPFIGLGFLSSIGLAPSEVGSVLRYMVKNAKKSPGKTAEEIQEKEERLEEKQEDIEKKLDALEILRKKTRFKKELDVINEKIDELEATPEEKKAMAEERKEERRRKKELLIDPKTGVEYDNETELKRYNPRLYNKNFGIRSQWFKEHKDEKKVEKKLNKELQKMEDKEFRYVRRNSDGSIKRNN